MLNRDDLRERLEQARKRAIGSMVVGAVLVLGTISFVAIKVMQYFKII